MKVLWIVNSLLPEALIKLGQQTEIKGTGGWVLALAEELQLSGDIQIHIAAITELVKAVTTINGERIVYHAIPMGKGDVSYNQEYEQCFRELNKSINPEVVHIHGSEYPHSLAALRAFGSEKTVVSIQGLISVIAKYDLGGLAKTVFLRNLTLHDILRGGVISQQRKLIKYGKYEEALLREAKFVIGRTEFDRHHTWINNNTAHYFHCDEILRKEFYDSNTWDYDNCQPHSIFISQAATPIKGLHKVIEALGIVSKIYPDVQLRVAGQDLTYRNKSIKDSIKLTGYGRVVKELLRKYKVTDKVFFTGRLNAYEMIREYLNANLFLCPSIIENSPNSLAEAQVLGVPVIASYAGGIPDMMVGDELHLYRFSDEEVLASKICELFECRNDVSTDAMRNNAINRHNPDHIVKNMVSVYHCIRESY